MPAAREPENNGLWNALPDPSSPFPGDDALWEMLNAYADGEAAPDEAARVEALLRDGTPGLSRDLAFLRQVSEGVDRIGDVEPPASLRDSILAATVLRPTPGQRLSLALAGLRAALVPQASRLALGGGALAAAGLAAFVFWPRGGQDNGTGIALTPTPGTRRVARNDVPPAPPTRGAETSRVTAEPRPTRTVNVETPKRPPVSPAPAPSGSRLALNPAPPTKSVAKLRDAAPPVGRRKPDNVSGMGRSVAVRAPKSGRTVARATTGLKTGPIVGVLNTDALPTPAQDLVPASFRPKMDAAFQRNLTGTTVAMLEDPDVTVRGTPDPGAAPPAAAPEATPAAPRPRTLVGRMNLPPDVSGVPSLPELRRRREAASRGFDAPPAVGTLQRPGGGAVVARF